MMVRALRWSLVATLVVAGPAWSAEAKYRIKVIKAEPPKELKEPVRKLLSDEAVQLLDAKGTALTQVWFRKEVPAKVTPEQLKNGLTYRDLKETTLLGAIQFLKPGADYRKQKVPAGVYTMRLGFQPMDGDHMGVSMFQDFCLLAAADMDAKPDPLEPKALQELSTKSINTTHPAVLMLFPDPKPPEKPQLSAKSNNHWVLNTKAVVSSDGKKGALGIGLTLVGAAE
jgi:hypothetical protein